jgi:hypothetical protein
MWMEIYIGEMELEMMRSAARAAQATITGGADDSIIERLADDHGRLLHHVLRVTNDIDGLKPARSANVPLDMTQL